MYVTVRVRSIVWFATGAALMLAAMFVVTSAWRADAAPADAETTFVPIAPCRLFDYRPGAGISPREAPIGPGETVAQQVTGAVGACNIPANANGVALNVTATSPTATSNLRIFPADVPVPNASNLNWTAGQAATPNKVDVKLSGSGAIGIYNDFGTVIPLADAVGYYISSTLVDFRSRLAALEASSTVAGVQDLLTRVTKLEASRPFAVFASGDQNLTVDNLAPDEIARQVTLTAPVAGTVVVNSSAYSIHQTAGAGAGCSITTGTTVDFAQLQVGESASGDNVNQMAGTRAFAVAAGSTTTFRLVCTHFGGASPSFVADSSMTAIFTPNP